MNALDLIAAPLRWLGGWLSRSMENPRKPLDPWSQAMSASDDGSLAVSGVRLNRKKSLTVPAFWRGVNLITRTVAKLPLGTYRYLLPGRERDFDHAADYLLSVQPCEGMTPYAGNNRARSS